MYAKKHDALQNDENYSITNKDDLSDEDIPISDESDDDVSQVNLCTTSNDNLKDNIIPDIFLEDGNKEDQQNEANFANAINVDKEEMNENSLLKLLGEYKLKKIIMVYFFGIGSWY